MERFKLQEVTYTMNNYSPDYKIIDTTIPIEDVEREDGAVAYLDMDEENATHIVNTINENNRVKNRAEELLNNYKVKFERKQRLIEPYIKRKNESLGGDWCTEVEYARYKAYEAEINLLRIVISDLEDIA